MSEQEYLEMIVAERIQMILADMEAGAVMDGEEEWEKTLEAFDHSLKDFGLDYFDQFSQLPAFAGQWIRYRSK